MESPASLIPLAAFLLALVALAVRWVVRSRRQFAERAAFITDYRFSRTLRERIAQAHPGLGPAQVTLVLEGLRQYFLACLSAQRRSIAKSLGMPSRAVDGAWHAFILMTREYASFCERAFGSYLHHTPGEQAKEDAQEALANTLHQFRQPLHGGAAAWAMAGSVPLLFALDRQLGLAEGHIHDDASLQALERTRLAMQAQSGDGGGGYEGGRAEGADAGGGGCSSE